MKAELSEFQKKIKAQAIVDNLILDSELSNLDSLLSGLFSDAEPEVREAISKHEVKELIIAVKNGTASNLKIARFLELANKIRLRS